MRPRRTSHTSAGSATGRSFPRRTRGSRRNATTTSAGGRTWWGVSWRRAGGSSPTPTTTTRTTRGLRSRGFWRSGAERDGDDPHHIQYGLPLPLRPGEDLRLGLRSRLRRGRDHDGRTLGHPPGRLSAEPRRASWRPDPGVPYPAVSRRLEVGTGRDPGAGREVGAQGGSSRGGDASATTGQAAGALEKGSSARGAGAGGRGGRREHAPQHGGGPVQRKEKELPPSRAPG